MPYVKKTRKYTKNSKKKTVKRSVGSKSSLVKTIKQVVNRQAETKHLNMDPIAYTWINPTLTNATMFDAISLTSNFNLAQGTSDGTRIGNSIDVTKCVLNMNIIPFASVNAVPLICTIFIGTLKGNNDFLPNVAQLDKLLQDGSGFVPMTPDTLCLLRNTNKDYFTISNKIQFKIGTSESTNTNYSNNDFPTYVNKKVTLKKLLGKMTFNDDDNVALKDLYMWCYYNGLDGAPSNLRPRINYYLDVEYKDF